MATLIENFNRMKEIEEGSDMGREVASTYYKQHGDQISILNYLASAAGIDRSNLIFDDADLVYGGQTVVPGALVGNLTLDQLADELKQVAVTEDDNATQVSIPFVVAKNPRKWMKVPGIALDQDKDDQPGSVFFKITQLSQTILNGIKMQELQLDTEMMNLDDIETLVYAGIDIIDDANRGIIDLIDTDVDWDMSRLPAKYQTD